MADWLPYPPRRPGGSRRPGWAPEAEAIIDEARDRIDTVNAAVDASETRIEALEAGGGGSAPDPLLASLGYQAGVDTSVSAANARKSYDLDPAVYEVWVDLAAWTNGSHQVAGNALYAAGGATAGTGRTFIIDTGKRARINTSITVPTGGPSGAASRFAFVGLNSDSPGAAPSPGNTIAIGINPQTHRPGYWRGGTIGGTNTWVDLDGTALPAGTYRVFIVADETSVSFVLKDSANVEWSYRADRAVIPTVNNLVIWSNDGRFTAGVGIGPLAARKGSATLSTREPAISSSDVVLNETWANLTNWVAGGHQVSGGKVYSSSSGGGPALSRGITPPNYAAHEVTATIAIPAVGGGGGLNLVGVGCGGTTHPDMLAIGVNTINNTPVIWRGANLGGAGQITLSVTALATGNVTVQMVVSATGVTLTLTDSASTTYTQTFTRASLLKAPTLNMIWLSDARYAAGGAVGAYATSTTPTAVTPWEGGTRSVALTKPASGLARLDVAGDHDSRHPAPLVIYCHGRSRTATGSFTDPQSRMLVAGLADLGYIVASSDGGGGSSWGNAASLVDYMAAYRYARDHYAISSILLIGQSMGGLSSLNLLTHHEMPTPAGWYGIAPVCDLQELYAANYAGAFAAEVRTAYGIAGDGSDYAAKTAGFDPAEQPGQAFRGVPMRVITSMSDGIIPPADHSAPLLAKVAAYTREASVETIAGTMHIPDAAFDPAKADAFFKRCLAS